MGLFSSRPPRSFDSSDPDDPPVEAALRAVLAREREEDDREPALWTEALIDTRGDRARAEALYTTRRLRQLRGQMADAAGDLTPASPDHLAPPPAPLDTGRWSPGYRRVLHDAEQGILHLALWYYLAFALIVLLFIAPVVC